MPALQCVHPLGLAKPAKAGRHSMQGSCGKLQPGPSSLTQPAAAAWGHRPGQAVTPCLNGSRPSRRCTTLCHASEPSRRWPGMRGHAATCLVSCRARPAHKTGMRRHRSLRSGLTVCQAAGAQAARLQHRPQAWQVICAVTGVSMLLCNLHRSVFTSLTPAVATHFGLDLGQVGVVQSAMLVGYLAGQLPAGVLADHVGGEWVMVVCLLLWSASLAATGASDSLAALLVSRAGFGLASACAMPAVSAMASKHVPPSVKAATIASIYAFFSLGGVLGLILTPIINTRLTWRAIMHAAGLGGAAWSLLGICLLRMHPPPTALGPTASTPGVQPPSTTVSSAASTSGQLLTAPVPVSSTQHTGEQIGLAALAGQAQAGQQQQPQQQQPQQEQQQQENQQQQQQLEQGQRQQEQQQQGSGEGDKRRLVQVLSLCWSHAVIGWGFFIFASWIPMFLRSLGSGSSVAGGGVLAAVPWVAAGTVGAISGGIADTLIVVQGWPRLKVRRLMHGISTLGCCVCMLPLMLGPTGPVAATACLTAFNSCYACSFGGFHAYIQDVAVRNSAGRLTGLTNSCSVLMGVLGNLSTGWLVQATGSYTSIFMATSVLYVSSFLVFTLVLDGKGL